MTAPKLEWKRVDEDPELHVLEVGGATATAHVRGSGAVWGARYRTGRNQTNASGRDLTLAEAQASAERWLAPYVEGST